LSNSNKDCDWLILAYFIREQMHTDATFTRLENKVWFENSAECVGKLRAATYVEHEKRVAWFSISIHACSSAPIVMVLRLAVFVAILKTEFVCAFIFSYHLESSQS